MRLPRQDIPLSLPAEQPRGALARDEALLDAVRHIDANPIWRWWIPASPAVVLGLGLSHRAGDIVDFARTERRGVEVLHRRAGGGALLLDEHILCGAVCLPLPHPNVGNDLTASYRWLGDCLADRLRLLGLAARRVDVAEARADVSALRARGEAAPGSGDAGVARLLLASCYGALSPHELAIGQAKVVGLAQIRRRHAALFQIGILLRDQSALADYLAVPDEPTRERVRLALRERSAGLEGLTDRSVFEVAAAGADARPSAR